MNHGYKEFEQGRARPGVAGRGAAWHGDLQIEQGGAWRGLAGYGGVWHGAARRGMVSRNAPQGFNDQCPGRGMARRGRAGRGMVKLNVTGFGSARQGTARHGMVWRG